MAGVVLTKAREKYSLEAGLYTTSSTPQSNQGQRFLIEAIALCERKVL